MLVWSFCARVLCPGGKLHDGTNWRSHFDAASKHDLASNCHCPCPTSEFDDDDDGVGINDRSNDNASPN